MALIYISHKNNRDSVFAYLGNKLHGVSIRHQALFKRLERKHRIYFLPSQSLHFNVGGDEDFKIHEQD